MCRGVVEECHIYDFLPVIGFQEEWEWEQDELEEDRFLVQVGANLYIEMDIDEYHDYLLRKEEEAFVRFRNKDIRQMTLNFSNNFMLKENYMRKKKILQMRKKILQMRKKINFYFQRK